MKTPSYLASLVILGGLAAFTSAASKDKAETAFKLNDPGTEKIVDYEKYGTITNLGTPQFRYLIKDRENLAKAVGEGIYPNVTGLLKDPAYEKAQYNKELEGSVWDFVNTENLQLNFFKWASNHDQPAGLRQFYIAQMLEKAGLIGQAIKAYQACVMHFPKTTGNTFWKTPWYIGPTALDSISYLTRQHPELGMRLEGGRIRIRNRFDDDPHNDVYEIDPGKIVSAPTKAVPFRVESLAGNEIKRRLGNGRVQLVQYGNGHWQLQVAGKPYIIRGIAYHATQIGKSPDDGTLVVHKDWMVGDVNKNGIIDGPYESWVDRNGNGKQDSNEKVVGDFKLLKDMGVNTIRLYHHGFNKKLLRDMYENYGISVVMGDYIGAYTVGSGAEWYKGTDYSDPGQQEKMLASIRGMVEEYKDEPYVLFWVLGNENNYGNANNSKANPEAYYQFLNRAAKLIKSIDKNRPVALCNGDLLFLDKAAKNCPDIDIYGANAYRGGHGFGDSFWKDLADEWGKPVFITEFGCPSYHHRKSEQEAEVLQAHYLRSNWEDLEYNFAGGPGIGNALGGILFEWIDEWWKAGPPPQYDSKIQDVVGQFGGPFPDGWSYEEWYGVVSQKDGSHSPFLRHLRKSYFLFKDELWNRKASVRRGLPE
jgi:beta-glucuronidase